MTDDDAYSVLIDNVDVNPYSTQGARYAWFRGYNALPIGYCYPRQYEQGKEYRILHPLAEHT